MIVVIIPDNPFNLARPMPIPEPMPIVEAKKMQTKCTVSISSFYPSMEIDDSIVQGSYQSKFIFKY